MHQAFERGLSAACEFILGSLPHPVIRVSQEGLQLSGGSIAKSLTKDSGGLRHDGCIDLRGIKEAVNAAMPTGSQPSTQSDTQ